jgi:NAD(P)-dependent dehydrogenase (short-subunit alcohol dehydrogenase family)
MHKNRNWMADDIPDQHGRTALVTGANSGLGFYTSRALAAKGARLVMACRSLEKGRQAASAIRKDWPEAALEVVALDLANLASVRSCASALAERHEKLDLLINNAGVMALPYRRSADGFEMHLGTNHLGHFALTGLLIPLLLAGDSSRIVTVSSGLHAGGKINFDDLHSKLGYARWRAYAQSKLANLLFAYELQRRLKRRGYKLISLAAHPGYAATNLQTAGPVMDHKAWLSMAMRVGNRMFAQSAQMGALPSLYAATSPDAQGGDYIGPGSLFGARGYPVKVRSSMASYDLKAAEKLWTISEEMTGVRYGTIADI